MEIKTPTRCYRWFLLQILLQIQNTISIFTASNTTDSSHLYNTLELLMMGIMVPETCWASSKICNKNSSVASVWHFISTYYRRCTVKTTSSLESSNLSDYLCKNYLNFSTIHFSHALIHTVLIKNSFLSQNYINWFVFVMKILRVTRKRNSEYCTL